MIALNYIAGILMMNGGCFTYINAGWVENA